MEREDGRETGYLRNNPSRPGAFAPRTSSPLPPNPPVVPALPWPSATVSPTPGPSASPIPIWPSSRVATIVFGDGSIAKPRAANARFQLVKVRAGESVAIALPVPPAAASDSVQTTALDGGRVVPGASITNGAAAISFQAGTQPGLYRLLVSGAGPTVTLQFWVPNPQSTAANPPVVNPTH